MTRLTVRDVMTHQVVAVPETASYREITDLLAERKISAVPVVNTADHVVGVVSEADLLYKIEFQPTDGEPRLFEGRRQRDARSKALADVAADLMTSPAITILPGASIVTAAKRMDANHVKRLPVVDELGRLIGIVSRHDLVRVFLRPDAEIRHEVTEQVLRRTLWVTPDEVTVTVTDGVVRLGGEVEHQGMIDIALRLTRAIDGVVDVVSEMVPREAPVTRNRHAEPAGPLS